MSLARPRASGFPHRSHALAGALLLALVPGLAAAQGAPGADSVTSGPRRMPRVDVSVSAGGAYTSAWFRSAERDGTPGAGPAAAAAVRIWLDPRIGVRLGGGYFAGTVSGSAPESETDLRNLHFDAALVVRPLGGSGVPGPLQSAYVYAGAGTVTSFVSGDDAGEGRCEAGNVPAQSSAVCLPDGGTVVQGVTGAGLDLVSLGPVTLFAEGSVSVYPSPARVARQPLRDPSTGFGSRAAADVLVPAIGEAADRTATTSALRLGGRISTGGAEAFEAAGTGTLVLLPVRPPDAVVEVYLVPVVAAPAEAGAMARFFCGLGSTSHFYQGAGTGTVGVRVTVPAQAYYMVVRRGRAYRAERVRVGRGRMAERSVDLVQLPLAPCPG